MSRKKGKRDKQHVTGVTEESYDTKQETKTTKAIVNELRLWSTISHKNVAQQSRTLSWRNNNGFV